jgi:hypothetical protein
MRWFFAIAVLLCCNPMIGAAEPALNAAQISIRDRLTKQDSLKPWQRVILETEVLPIYQAFVRSWDGKNADVDLALLKNYIDFRCETGNDSRFDSCDAWVLYRIEKSCQKCEQSLPAIKKTVENRLTRRGFQIVPLALDTIGIPPASVPLAGQDRAWTKEKELHQKLLESAAKNRVRSVISVSIRNLPPDSPDDPHADELHFGVNLFQAFRAESKSPESLATLKVSQFAVFSERLEFQVRDSAETLVERLMTEGTSQVASRLSRAQEISKSQVGADALSTKEVELELAGVRSFQHAARVRLRLESFFKEKSDITFREVRYQRGKILFILKGVGQLDSWVDQLGKVVIGDESLGEAEFLEVEKSPEPSDRVLIRASLMSVSKKKKAPTQLESQSEGES